MKRLALLLLATLTGCGDVLYVRAHSHNEDDDLERALDGASEIFGIPMEIGEEGPIIWESVRVQDPYPAGRYIYGGRCGRVIRSPPISVFLAHEIGHALGLDHVTEEPNLMTPSANGLDLTDEQLDAAERKARQLRRCP